MLSVSVPNKPRFTACPWAACRVIKVGLINEKHEWRTYHIVSVSFWALAAGPPEFAAKAVTQKQMNQVLIQGGALPIV